MSVAEQEHSVRVELRRTVRRRVDARGTWEWQDAVRFAKERYNKAVVEWDVFLMAFWSDYLDGLGVPA